MFKFRGKEVKEENFVDIIKLAHEEWIYKRMLLDEVTDPDLIDCAIYETEASKIKYIYLLKKYKQELQNGNIFIEENRELAFY